MQELKKYMPAEVASLISRIVECNHWGGEEPYNSDRAKQIGKSVDRLKCRELPEDERKIRLKYKNRKEILSRIDKAKALVM